MTARAMFTEPAAAGAPQLTTLVRRSEIERILASGDDAELRLDVLRIEAGDPPRREQRDVTVGWERADLERLLRLADGRFVTLSIDAESLAQALDEEEVEAHGLREKVLVLTLAAATAAGAGAAAADGAVDREGGTMAQSGVPAAMTAVEGERSDLLARASAESSAVPAAVTDVEAQRGALLARASDEAVSGPLAAYTAVETARAELLAASSGSADTLPAALTAVETARAELLAASSGSADTLPAALTAVETARAELLAASSSPSAVVDGLPAALTAVEIAHAELRAAQAGSPAGVSTDGPLISAPSPEQVAVGVGAGALALAIVGAAFVARRRAAHPA